MAKITLEFDWDEFSQLNTRKAKPAQVAKRKNATPSIFYVLLRDYDESTSLLGVYTSPREASKALEEAQEDDKNWCCAKSYITVQNKNARGIISFHIINEPWLSKKVLNEKLERNLKGADWDIDELLTLTAVRTNTAEQLK